MIWFTADLHFCHDKDFLYVPRGFSSIEEHDEAIVRNHNSVVDINDDVYIVGDWMLLDNEKAMEYISRLNGNLHFIIGNHDTPTRQALIEERYTVLGYATVVKYKKYIFYVSHYPTLTSNFDIDKPLKARVINLCGHVHTKDRFSDMDKGLIYHVELDAHNNYPVSVDEIIDDIKDYVGGRDV
jgi:calcineurin-like phosphoesterase family protein